MQRDGYRRLHVLADFDGTLTYGAVRGKNIPSLISILRDGRHLTKDYAKKAHALYNTYHPIEHDPSAPKEQKKEAMRKWWETHNRLLIESGLLKTDLEDIVANGPMQFREGIPEFLDLLHANNIPLVILSSSGCGDAIPLFFKKIDKVYPNIFFVTNTFEWDSVGKAIAPKEPIIHSMNKDETAIEAIPEIREVIRGRTNVLLLGNSIGDLGMIEGFRYTNLITVGFLNREDARLQSEFEKHFDIIAQGDGDAHFINALIRELTT